MKVLRTVLSGGRRYEQFTNPHDFRRAAKNAEQAAKLAEPIIVKNDLLLAIENHKDFARRTDGFAQASIASTSASASIPVTASRFWKNGWKWCERWPRGAFTVHLKDMAVAEYDEGFLLAEVPLGEGFLDLPKMIALLREARLAIHFNLEMITAIRSACRA